ncbi:MAG: hypothetical protein ABS75_17120 [Pelagibacterium sp. SCN 63-23]|nr:MAG: hypothetical protein ABS75_17120 [Pelagibacterium sp. SCN 63-23]
MTKKSVLALITAAAVAGVSLPAMAAPAPVVSETAAVETDTTPSYDFDRALTLLQKDGINATRVESWGSVLRAFVIEDSGAQTMRFFDPDTLAPVNL